MNDRPRIAMLLAVVCLVVACAGNTSPTFDVAKVKANFAAECEAIWDTALDQDMCDNVTVEAISADGSTLIVPTTFGPGQNGRTGELCDVLAWYHNDRDNAQDLGYKAIRVLNVHGSETATCNTRY